MKSLYRHVPRSKNLGGHTVIRRAAACRRRLLICQHLGGHLSPLPPPLAHACNGTRYEVFMSDLKYLALLAAISKAGKAKEVRQG